MDRARLFFSEVRNELNRVTWPSKQEVYASTVVVIITSLVLGFCLWGFDRILDRVEYWLLLRFAAG